MTSKQMPSPGSGPNPAALPHRLRAKPASAPPVPNRPVIGKHPSPPNVFGDAFVAVDHATVTMVAHRALAERSGGRAIAISGIREMIIRHHASPQQLARSKAESDALQRLGMAPLLQGMGRFPANPQTRKGNLAEIVLAEYVAATTPLKVPVYRLRYNPNVEQSMKGDDVLAFDLDADPVRVVVGEAKFRAQSTRQAVEEIVQGLERSRKAGIPISLLFVADRLFDEGRNDLGRRVLECATLFALGKLQIDYVGFLLSDEGSASRVDNATPVTTRRLAMVSLGVSDPVAIADACFDGLA